MSSWIESRMTNYKFQPEREDLRRWEAEERTIHRRRLTAAVMFLVATPLLVWAKPHVDNTVWPRAFVVLGFGAVYAAVVLLWRNPFRWVSSSGKPGDCTVRGY